MDRRLIAATVHGLFVPPRDPQALARASASPRRTRPIGSPAISPRCIACSWDLFINLRE
jgi:hypothetical protein